MESVSELAGWHGYHGTNSLSTEETAANCRAASGRNRLRVRQCEAPFVSLLLFLTCNQTAKEPACHQGYTDGLLLGGCEFNADLRAIAVLFTAAHIQIYTTGWQINTLTFLCQIKYM